MSAIKFYHEDKDSLLVQQAIRDSDLAISIYVTARGANGMVVKDRDDEAGRMATPEEVASARLVDPEAPTAEEDPDSFLPTRPGELYGGGSV
jgi:hypothetical protein